MSDQIVIAIGGTATALLTGFTAWASKRKVERGIQPHLETLTERVAGIEGRLGGIERTQDLILENLLKKE